MRALNKRRRGFSLIEVMISLAIMLVGAVGAMAGIINANKALYEGQRRLYKSILIDHSLSRARMQNKELLYNSAVAAPGSAATMPNNEAIGTGNWVRDPTVIAGNDLSTGSLFFVGPNGSLMRCNAGTQPSCPAAITTCADAAIPNGVFCREIAITKSAAAFAPGAIVNAGTFVSTVWVSVIEKKAITTQTVDGRLMGREVFAQ